MAVNDADALHLRQGGAVEKFVDLLHSGFGALAAMLLHLAEKHAGGRIAFLLEGGYDLAALKNSVAAVLEAMREKPAVDLAAARGAAIDPLVRRVLRVQEKYWAL